MDQRFEKLVCDFCAATGMSFPDRMINGAPFTVNQVVFSLTHKPHVNDDLFFVHADFGAVRRENDVGIYYELLRENFLDFSLVNASFGISAATGRIVYAAAYRLDEVGTEDLIVTLTTLTCKARLWNIDHNAAPPKSVLAATHQRPYFLTSRSKGKDEKVQ